MRDRIEIYDVLLVVTLIGAAWRALFGKDAFSATVFFIVYGLLMAMAWVQLDAIDVALAEACVGAGLTGALLIGAVRQFERAPGARALRRTMGLRASIGALSLLALAGLTASLFEIENRRSPVPPLVERSLGDSGSAHPVTAMLLNFRAFDTWLEIGVLLIASLAAISIHRLYDPSPIEGRASTAPTRPRLQIQSQTQPWIMARTLLPLLILVGGAMLWFGSHAPGGAFQSGALIGAAGILLQIAGGRSALRLSSLRTRSLLSLGFSSFWLMAAGALLAGGRILEYPPASAGAAILALEAAATLSIALTLNVMYACSRPWGPEP